MPCLKRIAASLALLLAVTTLSALEISLGLEGAVNYSIVSTSTRWENTSLDNFVGMDVMIPLEFRFTDWLAVDTGIRYIMKDAYYKKSYNGSNIDEFAILNHFLEFPLTAQFSAGSNKVRVFLGLGGYLGVRLAETHIGSSMTLINGTESYAENVKLNSDDNRFDAGLIAEGGFRFPFRRGDFYIKTRYQYSLTSLAKDSQTDTVHTYLDSLSFAVAYLFKLGGPRW